MANFNAIYKEIVKFKTYSESVEFTKEPWKSLPENINYISNLSIDGINIQLCESKEISDEKLNFYAEHLEKDVKIFKAKYKGIIKEEFKKLLKIAGEWEVPANSVDKLMKIAGKVNTIEYTYHQSREESSFILWYNSKAPYNSDFFGGHCFVVEVTIKNGKINKAHSSLEG